MKMLANRTTYACAILAITCSCYCVSMGDCAEVHPEAGLPRLRIACSHPSSGLLEEAASEYRRSVARIRFELQPIHNDSMMRQMSLGYADMSVHTGPLDMFDLNTLRKGFPGHGKFEELPIAQFTVAMVVHSGVGVRSLTTEQIGQICRGEVTNWEDLGGPKREIVLVGQSMRYNSTDILRRTTFPNQQLTDSLVEKNNKRSVIAAVKETPGAIGFFLHDWQEIDGLRPLSVAPCDEDGKQVGDPAELSQAAVLEGRYPIADPLVVVFHPDAPPEAYDFFEFLKTEAVAKMATERRMLTEFHRQELLRKKRLAQQRAGQGTEITVAGPPAGVKLADDLARLYVEEQGLLQIKYAAQRQAADAVAALMAGEAELLFVDGDAAEFAAQLREHDSQILGRRAVGVIVHPANEIKELLLDDLKMIYEGEVPNWPGETAKLQMVGPESSGIVAEVFRKVIGGGRRKVPYAAKASTEQIIRTVARDPAAIGIVDLSDFPAEEQSVRLVPILRDYDQPEATAPRLPLPSDYPLARTYTLYVSPTASEEAKQFVKFLTAPRLAEVLAPHGLLP